jgi:hypothetical protein
VSSIGLVLIILVPVLLGLGAAGYGIWLAVRQLGRRHTDTQAKVYAGPNGQIVDVPVMQISRLAPGQSLVALGRNTGHASFRIHGHGVEYRILRRRFVPFVAITQVDAPYAGRPYFTMWIQGQTTGLGILATAEPAVQHALWYLSRTCPLTSAARARIGW